MKTPWYRKKLTFLVIRDVHRSVVQFKILKPLLVVVPVIMVAITTALIWLYNYHNDAVDQHHIALQQLNEQLASAHQNYETVIASKNKTIDSLQIDVISLSHQADQIKAKVDELMKLELELRDVTEPIAQAGDIVTIASAHNEQLNILSQEKQEGVGGEHIPVSDEDITKLAISTESQFHVLDSDIDLLIEHLEEAKGKIIEYQEHLRVTPSIYPTDSQRITSSFGYRSDPFTKRPSFHAGIDFGGKRNDPIYATADGVVQSTGYNRNAGNHVIIQHENGIRTFYYHLQKSLVTKGQEVSKGEEIGKLGSTGRSTGPHLHYEIEVNGVKVDPKPYLHE